MAKLTFSGGIHPYDGKEMSKDIPIKEVYPVSDLVYPLSQHIGAPAKPIVAKGDHVLAGQKIAEADGFVSSPIYASVSGTVKAIEERRVVTGNNAMSIVIENDGLYNSVEPWEVKPLEEMSNEEIIARIREAGIVGMGGAGFPTHVKLSVKEPAKIDYVIVNGAECEPYLTSDYRKMVEEPEKLLEGLRVYLKLFPYSLGIVAIEDNKPDCIKVFKALTKDEPRITVKALRTKYPQGSERQLIYAVTGREINSKLLPADVGCVVNNVDTVISVRRAIYDGMPLMHRIVTVTGNCIKNPRNFKVLTGTSYADLVPEAGGFKKEPVKIISGGPMMGFCIFDLNVPVTKTASALLCLSRDDISRMEPSACINCGQCVEVCPSRLLPKLLSDHAANFNEEEFLSNHGLECVECGCCSFICPAKRPLCQNIKSLRKICLAKKKK
ncbi:MAG: electron transport complex subunit RsxC [Lachnospiraceae bacterium]|nr:electron transport complex subunit RsxC [Lachnospiraceae bacterium]